MGDEEGVIEFESPDSCLAAYPTEVGVTLSKGKRSGGVCGRRKRGLYPGVANSGSGTRSLGTCGRNIDSIMGW